MTRYRTKQERRDEQVEIKRLVAEAKRLCEGCRANWRLEGFKHREPVPIDCRARPERQRLREIARAARDLIHKRRERSDDCQASRAEPVPR